MQVVVVRRFTTGRVAEWGLQWPSGLVWRGYLTKRAVQKVIAYVQERQEVA